MYLCIAVKHILSCTSPQHVENTPYIPAPAVTTVLNYTQYVPKSFYKATMRTDPDPVPLQNTDGGDPDPVPPA